MADVVEPDVAPVEPVPTPTPGSPVAPPVETPPDPDEQDAIELPQGKHVPLSALKAQREENKALKERLAAAATDVQFAQQNRGVLEFIQQHPELLRPQAAPPPSAPVGADPQLTELARALDYYKSDGTPDLDRAAKFNSIIDTRAEQKARAMVEPVAGTLLHQQSERNWHAAVAEKLPNGQGINSNLLADAWRAVQQYPNGAQILADPRAVKVIVNTVKMQQMETGGQLPTPPPPTSGPPVKTEGQGNAPRGPRVAITDTERAIVGGRMTDDKYAQLTKDFKPGRPNVLED